MATVLIVDDEQVVIHIARIALERAGHKVFAANSGEEAELLSAEIERIDVLIVNHRVPPYTGREIAERLLQAHPTARVVHISGYPRQHLESEGGLTPGSSFLPKPFTIRQIQDHVSSILTA